MVLALAGPAVVASAGSKRRRVEAVHSVPVRRLEGEVQPRGDGRAGAEAKFIHLQKIAIVIDWRQAEGGQHGIIEPAARRQVRYLEMDVIEQTADMVAHPSSPSIDRSTPGMRHRAGRSA